MTCAREKSSKAPENNSFATSFVRFEIKEGANVEVGESKVRLDYRKVNKTRCSLEA